LRIIKTLKSGLPLSSIWAIHEGDDDNQKRKRKYDRMSVEEVNRAVDLLISMGILKKTEDTIELYVQMSNHIQKIQRDKNAFISDYLSKDPELGEFMYRHSSDSTRKMYLSKFYGAKRVIKIPKDLAPIIREFDGKPFIEKLPLLIQFDGVQFSIKDMDFEYDNNESLLEEWKNAPILVL
jgi:hypothetical protein